MGRKGKRVNNGENEGRKRSLFPAPNLHQLDAPADVFCRIGNGVFIFCTEWQQFLMAAVYCSIVVRTEKQMICSNYNWASGVHLGYIIVIYNINIL